MRGRRTMEIRSGMIMAALLGALCGCSSPGVRAVPDVSPRIHGYEVLSAARTNAGAFSISDFNEVADGSFHSTSGTEGATDRHPLQPGAAASLAWDEPASDERQAWVSQGWPLEVDLGAGEFPYDDGMHPVDGSPLGQAGFSSSIIRFTWREPLSGPFGVHGTAALARAQEDPLLDALSEMRLSWLAVGLHASF